MKGKIEAERLNINRHKHKRREVGEVGRAAPSSVWRRDNHFLLI